MLRPIRRHAREQTAGRLRIEQQCVLGLPPLPGGAFHLGREPPILRLQRGKDAGARGLPRARENGQCIEIEDRAQGRALEHLQEVTGESESGDVGAGHWRRTL